jgi:hypothetical protein
MVPNSGVQPEVAAVAAAAAAHDTSVDVRATQKKERTACGDRGDGKCG